MSRTGTRVGTTVLAAVALVAAGSPSWASDDHGRTWTVEPGSGTITAAIDKAKSGDTLKLKPGVFVDAASFGSKAISVEGSGQHRTTIMLPETLPEPDPSDFCRGEDGAAAGLCWISPDGEVKVSDLSTVGHAIGILGFEMDGMEVEDTIGRDHDEYGVAAFSSHGIDFTDNTEYGDGGEAGFYVGDTANADAVVEDNVATGWLFGVFFRDSRHGTAEDNRLTKNCVGALVLDTGPNGGVTEGGETFTNYPAGAWTLEDNDITANNRFCPAEEEAPPLTGHGVLVIGADRVRVEDNHIARNNGAAGEESAFPSSGVTIISGEFVGSDDPRKVTVEDNDLNNHLDVYWDRSGQQIRFDGNDCDTSTPRFICD